MAARRRWQGTTTERGYGAPHVRELKRRLAMWRPGDPCARCGQPMWDRWFCRPDGTRVSAIDLGHTDDRTGYTGLEHRRCNRGAGARKRNQLAALASAWRSSRQW